VGLDGGWPGSCHEQELLTPAGLEDALDRVQVVSLLDRGFRGMAKPRGRWHMPLGDRRTKDQLTQAQQAYNHEQAGLRALVEQAIAIWATRGCCAAGAGCCTGSGRCSAPLGC
jgi:DDE superfamily endonuclease